MSQPGFTEPATSSLDSKPSLPPAKVSADDEAEEGEIVDEEEGEISESQPADSAVSVSTPVQPSTAAAADGSGPSAEQPQNAVPSTGDTAVNEVKPQDGDKALPSATAPTDKVTPESAQATQSADTTEATTEPSQQPAEAATDATADSTTEATAIPASVPEPVEASSSAPTETTTQPPQAVEEPPVLQKSEDPSTPKLTEAQAPLPDETPAASSTVQDQTMEDTPTAVSIPPPTEAQPEASNAEAPAAEAEPKAGAPADMDVDDKVVVQAPASTHAAEQTADSVHDAMQVDSTVHTPALPSDGPETPAEPAAALPAQDRDEQEAPAQELAPSSAEVKSEPQAEAQEQTQVAAAVNPPSVQAAPVVDEPQTSQEQPQKEEAITDNAGARPEPLQDQEMPAETSQADAQASTSEAPRPEEIAPRVERTERSASRPAELEPAQSKTTNPASAAPSSVPERRVERERTKDRSHPPERSQDREQRAREKDRRRELERLERERERERERIRKSERDREMMIARENEEARLIWLSLPGNDHPQYYTDTDSDSCYGAVGAFGVDLSDEEDKDLNPPLPLSLQEYHPAPSYSQSYYDDSFYSSKRKRVEDGNDDATSRRPRQKLISTPSAGDSWAASSSTPVHRDALPSTTMINIDDFPVPDSDIRGEPSDRPCSTRIERSSLPLISPYTRSEDAPMDDDVYSSDTDEEALRIAEERKRRHGHRGGNRGNKLSREKGARWIRRGKLGGWTEMRMEKEIGDRVRHRVEAMQKDNVRALLSAMPEEDKAMLAEYPVLRNGLIPSTAPGDARRDARGRLLPSDLSEAARIDAELGLDGGSGGGVKVEKDERLTSTSLAPTLLKPAITPRQLLTSHTLRHTFRNPHIAALGKTALDLIESEGVVGRAVGRCWAAMERGGWNEDPEPKGDEAENDEPVNGMDVDEPSDSSSALFASSIDNPALSHLDKLFVTKNGLAIPRLDDVGQPIFVPPSPATQAARAEAGLAEEPVIETTLLPAPEQRSIVLAALECLHDLAADSREYVERLEEVRSRLAAVKRRRAQVWNAVRQWALDRDLEAEVGLRNGDVGTAAGSAAAAVATAAVGANGASPRKRK